MSKASSFEHSMLALMNAERASHGLKPLMMERRLNDSAEDYSDTLLAYDAFSHTGPDGSSSNERMRDAGFDFTGSWSSGENLAMQSLRGAPGISDDVRELHEALMDSPGHRANILNPKFEVAGIGIELGEFRGFQAVMITQHFGRTESGMIIEGDWGHDVLIGRGSSDRLFGGGGNDLLNGGSGDDRLYGGSGNDRLYGKHGDDVLKGHSGSDMLSGYSGRDLLYGGSGNDVLRGGSWNDDLRGGSGNDRLQGDGGNDKLRGGSGDDRMTGGSGNDYLNGQRGSDRIDGGTGWDTLRGGSGSDVFVFAKGGGSDKIRDFENGSDRIHIDIDGVDYRDLSVRDTGDDVQIRVADVTITLEDEYFSGIGSSDFIFG